MLCSKFQKHLDKSISSSIYILNKFTNSNGYFYDTSKFLPLKLIRLNLSQFHTLKRWRPSSNLSSFLLVTAPPPRAPFKQPPTAQQVSLLDPPPSWAEQVDLCVNLPPVSTFLLHSHPGRPSIFELWLDYCQKMLSAWMGILKISNPAPHLSLIG